MFCKAPRLAPRMLSLPAALASALVALSHPVDAFAQPTAASATAPVHFYQLEAGPLARTLDAISAISGTRIAYNPEQLKSAQARRVAGNYSPGAAVSQAIAGSGFNLNEDGNGVIAITPVSTVQIVATRDEAETAFRASRSDTATRSGANLHDVPGSVTLITSKVLETQQVTNLQDALRNVSGISFRQSPQGTPAFSVRGFSASATSNGVSDSHASATNVFGVERIEVLKGPQAILSGGDSSGGGVNIVLKKPQADVIRDLTVQYGSNADRTVAADFSGPVGDDKRLTYRLIGSVARASRSDSGFNGRENNAITPSLRWKDATTDVIVSASYTEQRAPIVLYTFARRDGAIMPTPEIVLGNPADGIDNIDKRVNYQLEHKFDPALTFISRMQYAENDYDLHVRTPLGLQYATGAARNAPNGSMMFLGGRTQSADNTLSGDHYLRWTFRTAGVLHKMSAGVNHTDYHMRQFQTSGPSVTAPIYPPTAFTFPALREAATSFVGDSYFGQRQKALYVQDMASIGKWTALVNLRRNDYIRSTTTNIFPGRAPSVTPSQRYLTTTPGAGVVYRLSETTSLYASYAEGFVPQIARACAGGLVPPRETKNKEFGAKFDLLDSKLSITASVFSLEESTALQFDRLNNCYIVRAGQKTDGAEIDLQGRIAPGLDLVFNYTYNRVKDVGNAATRYAAMPKHKMSSWAVYRLRQEAFKGLGFGLGVNANSSTLGTIDPVYPYTLPGQAQVDASVFYDRGPWGLTFGIKNLADRKLFGATSGSSFVPLLAGREYMLTVKRSFK